MTGLIGQLCSRLEARTFCRTCRDLLLYCPACPALKHRAIFTLPLSGNRKADSRASVLHVFARFCTLKMAGDSHAIGKDALSCTQERGRRFLRKNRVR